MTDPTISILAVRVMVLGLGAILCLMGSMKAFFQAFNLPPSEFKGFFRYLGASLFVLGLVLLLFSFGDAFKYTTEPSWATTVTDMASLLGVAGIVFFVMSISKITRYVGS